MVRARAREKSERMKTEKKLLCLATRRFQATFKRSISIRNRNSAMKLIGKVNTPLRN